MWVSRIARGSKSPSAASNVSSVIPGPGSISTPSTSQQQMTFSRPLCRTSIARMGLDPSGGADFPRSAEIHRSGVNLAPGLRDFRREQGCLRMGEKFRVLVADHHPLFLFAIAHTVKAREELELVA